MRLHLLAAATLLAVATGLPLPTRADVAVNVNVGPPPIVVVAPPPLVVVPAVPAVQYVPSIEMDVFIYGGSWYYPYGGRWFVGPSYRGPWRAIPLGGVPRPVLAVPVRYYKIPPGHLSSTRHGVDGPPGHAKGWGKR